MDKYTYVDVDKKTSVIMEFTAKEQEEMDARQKAFEDGAEDRAWFALRAKRDKLLAETDWMANSDVTMSDAWKTYRQELRDMTKTLSDDDVANLEEIEWPKEPS